MAPDDVEAADERSNVERPVVRLRKALSGHPGAGTFWERHCDQELKKAGFNLISENWNSCCWHRDLPLFLVVSVDAFELSGPATKLAEG